MNRTNTKAFADLLLKRHNILERKVILDLNGYRIALRSNSEDLLKILEAYFSHVSGSGDVDIEVLCIDSEVVDAGVEFVDWKREPGKTGRKDAYYDLEDGRLVLKVRTGMLFLQSETYRIAAGPCVEYDNQVINFINAQYMNWLQQQGQLICHASGLVINDQCMAIAGFSGGGKSTLMLHMLAKDGVAYLTNDRLFLSRAADSVMATGIPKLPRINPGTIVNDPLLTPLLTAERRKELLGMPKEELWHLEEKYDVDVSQVYGDNKIVPRQRITRFLILNWKFNDDQPCNIHEVDLNQRHDLLAAVMKSPGPFYHFREGDFFTDEMQLDEALYLDMMQGITVYEATGKVDFDFAIDYCIEKLS
mgnify:FL=1